MNKHLILLPLVALGVASSGFANGSSQHKRLPKPRVASVVNMARFTGIHANGNLSITLNPGNARYQVVKNPNQQYVSATVKGRQLYLNEVTVPHHQPQRVHVTVRMNQLHTIDTTGKVSIKAKNIRASHLHIHASGQSHVNLAGNMDVRQINASQNAHVFLRWVNSKQLQIHESGRAYTKISGVANQVQAKVKNASILNATYLRTQHMWAQTQNSARISTLPINSLRAFASDQSNIYFYKMPAHLTRLSTGSGNILQLDWRA